MKQVVLTIALLLAASPAASQVGAQREEVITLGAQREEVITPSEGAPSSSQVPTTGVICEQMMVATFCNVVTSPSTGGYGSSSGAGGTVGSSSVPTPTPPCGEFPPANELCN
jgi:hypothetical protein